MQFMPRSAAVLFGLLSLTLLSACSSLESAYGGMTQPAIHRAIMKGELGVFYDVYLEQANEPGNNPEGILPLERLFSREVMMKVPARTRYMMLEGLINAESRWTGEAFRGLAYYGDPALTELALNRGLDPDQYGTYMGDECPLVMFALESVYAMDLHHGYDASFMDMRRRAAVGTTQRLLQAGASMTRSCKGRLTDKLYDMPGRSLYEQMAVMMHLNDDPVRGGYLQQVLASMQATGRYSKLEARRALRTLDTLQAANDRRVANQRAAEERRRARQRAEDEMLNRAFSGFANGLNQRAREHNRRTQVYSQSATSSSEASADDSLAPLELTRADESEYPADEPGAPTQGSSSDSEGESFDVEVETIQINNCYYSGNCDGTGGHRPSNAVAN